MRPKTLAEVAQLTINGDSFDRCLANFLDGFYAAPNARALADVPPLLAPGLGEPGRVQDAYLAATAEELANAHQFPVVAWTADEARKLHRPWFASPLAGLRAVPLLESTAAFSSRNLFIGQNALTRACPPPAAANSALTQRRTPGRGLQTLLAPLIKMDLAVKVKV